MRCEVITDKDINEIENNTFKSKIYFDSERRDFIKNLEKINVSAAAGCGKTTTLIAKIKILEKKQPFDKEQGICLLSHTNVAIDEANRLLGKESKIWKYPNYCGTIQKFINNFIFKMIYNSIYKSKIQIIDSNFYCKFFFKYLSIVNNSHKTTLVHKKFDPECVEIYHDHVKYKNESIENYINKNFKDPNLKIQYTKSINLVIETLCQEGVFTYSNAFNYSISFLENNPIISNYFSNRFKYVFIDEAQDIDDKQYKILKLLFDNTNVQYIGDTNQAIYNQLVWDKGYCLNISKSYRLSKTIAEFSSNFEIESSGIFSDNITDIPVTLIIFNKSNISKVLYTYEKLIAFYRLDAKVNKVVGKIKKENANGLTLASYLTDTNTIDTNNNLFSIDYFLNINTINDNYMGSAYKSIVECLYIGIRLLYNKSKNKKIFNKHNFFQELSDSSYYKDIVLRINSIMKFIYSGQDSHDLMVDLIEFIANKLQINVKKDENYNNFIKRVNINSKPNTKLEISSIKGVKGETHCSTLLVDTYYRKLYHIDRVLTLFNDKKKNISNQDQEFIREFYVAVTRPKKLLCLAIEETTYNKHKDYLSKLNVKVYYI